MKNFIVYTDKPTEFDFKVEVEGASLDDAKARLIIETQKTSFLLEGNVKSDGSAVIEIPKLKGLVEDNISGKMRLEVIVEDAYFQPWEGTYQVAASKKVTVNEVLSEKPAAKPAMSITIKEKKTPYQANIESIVESLSSRGITSTNILNDKNKKYMYSLIEVVFNKSLTELNNKVIINDIIHNMNGVI